MCSKRIARDASQQWIGADYLAALDLCKLHGRIASPTFFWGGETARATGNLLYANRLIPMGVWRDPSQPGTEETGALSDCSRILKFKTGC